ncbi:DNA topoisomerase 2-like [Daphnia pulicaria]|uniref:DNA topoisomerase 2-like n=1 Tax=Daphnia pulicaria TaxID=35523 RepID=UPI001EEB3BEF|nr:DNA topoisomerase 2-like [Daphnia pulicaria]
MSTISTLKRLILLFVLVEQLRQRGYDPNPILIWKRKVGLNAEVAKIGKFDYLLAFLKPPYSDLRGSKEELMKNRENCLKRFDVILKKSPVELWCDDLAAFSVAFKKIEDDEQKELASIAESRREEKKSRQDSDSDDAPKPSAKKANLRFN